MKEIIFSFGTRPEAIKMVPVIKVFKKDKTNYNTIVIVTGQHREMLDRVLSTFDIKPDYDLDLMTTDQSLGKLTSKILMELDNIFTELKPDLIFAQGDTITTFATSLASFYQKIPLGHIEAGLRTNNIYSPFPEELNRRITSLIATYHFAPTKEARENLLREGVKKEKIFITGNTGIDTFLSVSDKLDNQSINEKFEDKFQNKYGIKLKYNNMILVTGHRRESFGQGLKNICEAIKLIAKNNNEIQIVYPVHLNPNVKETVFSIIKNINNVYLIEPQDYESFVFLIKKAYFLLTDSGGIQEEAPAIGKPVLIMRENTERPEGILAGTTKLVGTDKNKIINMVQELLTNDTKYKEMSKAINPYGDGTASEKIFNYINSIL